MTEQPDEEKIPDDMVVAIGKVVGAQLRDFLPQIVERVSESLGEKGAVLPGRVNAATGAAEATTSTRAAKLTNRTKDTRSMSEKLKEMRYPAAFYKSRKATAVFGTFSKNRHER